MRIGLITGPGFPVPPPAYGGTERVVDTLARGFAAAGHEVLLAAPTDSRCPVPLAAGMHQADPTQLGSVPREVSHLIRAYKAMGGMDLIHDHTLIGPLYGHRLGRIPAVTTIHGRLLPDVVEIYRAMSSTTHIIAISHDQIRDAQLPIDKVIHHGMDLARVPVGMGKDGYACFLGRMCPDKGVLEAVLIAHAAGLPLMIAAKMREPAELDYFHNVVEPVLGKDDQVVGEIGDTEKFALLGNAVALLSPLQWPEPFGLMMIEALATGTPVFGTALGAAPEIVDNGITGYLAPLKELPGLLPLAATLDRAACRAAVEKRFSASRMVADHLDLYQEILTHDPTGVPPHQAASAPSSGKPPGRRSSWLTYR